MTSVTLFNAAPSEVSPHASTTPSMARFRNGTKTRYPIRLAASNASGMRYVNAVRSGTGKATSQVRTMRGASLSGQYHRCAWSAFRTRGSEAEQGHYFLQVRPDFRLCMWITEQISRMVGCDELRTAKFEPLSAE